MVCRGFLEFELIVRFSDVHLAPASVSSAHQRPLHLDEPLLINSAPSGGAGAGVRRPPSLIKPSEQLDYRAAPSGQAAQVLAGPLPHQLQLRNDGVPQIDKLFIVSCGQITARDGPLLP